MKFELAEKENKKAHKFRKKHRHPIGGGVKSEGITYLVYVGPIGVGVSIKCTICGQIKDITDYGIW